MSGQFEPMSADVMQLSSILYSRQFMILVNRYVLIEYIGHVHGVNMQSTACQMSSQIGYDVHFDDDVMTSLQMVGFNFFRFEISFG